MIGRTLLFYKLMEKLGEGAHSAVYRAIDLKQDRETMFMAVKVFHHSTYSKTARQNYFHIAENIRNHRPNGILSTSGCEETEEGQLFLSMPFQESVSLKTHLAKGPMTFKATIAIAIRALQGLAALHHIGIFHHNLKPSNILITHKGEILLTDAGMRGLYGPPPRFPGTNFSENSLYLAPEQINGGIADHRSDFWTIGAIIYHTLTGHPPFDYTSEKDIYRAIAEENPPNVSRLRCNPQVLQRFFQRTLAKKPGDRYPTLHHIFNDLKLLASQDESNNQSVETLTIETRKLPAAEWHREPSLNGTHVDIPVYTPPTPPGDCPTIAVLPFNDERPPQKHLHFHNSFLIDLITELTIRKDVWVMPMAATLFYRDQNAAPRDIGDKLGVRHVLLGHIKRLGGMCYLLAELVDVADGRKVWEKHYQVPADKLLPRQEQLAKTIIDHLLVEYFGLREAGKSAAGKAHSAAQPPAGNSDRPAPETVITPAVDENRIPAPVTADDLPATSRHTPAAPGRAQQQTPDIRPITKHAAAGKAEEARPANAAAAPTSPVETPSQPAAPAAQSKPDIRANAASQGEEPARAPATNAPEKPPVIRHTRQPAAALPDNGRPGQTVDSEMDMAEVFYRQGMRHLENCTVEDLRIAKAHLQKSIELSPAFAPAYAGLSRIYNILSMFSFYAPTSAMPLAMKNAYFALEKQPTNAAALICLGNVLAIYEWDWAHAKLCFEQGLREDPDDANAWHWYAINYLLPGGQSAAALQALEKALQLQPEALLIEIAIARLHMLNRNPDSAVVHCERLLLRRPEFPLVNLTLGCAYLQAGQYSAAMPQFQIALQAYGQNSSALAMFAHAAAAVGRFDISRKVLNKLLANDTGRYISGVDLAVAHLAVRESEPALQALQKALAERANGLIYLNSNPLFDPLRDSGEFRNFLSRLRLPAARQNIEKAVT